MFLALTRTPPSILLSAVIEAANPARFIRRYVIDLSCHHFAIEQPPEKEKTLYLIERAAK